jgi:hypothetical protein
LAEIDLNKKSTAEIILRKEIELMSQHRPANVKIYPPLNISALGVDGSARVCRAVKDCGMEGLVFTGLEQVTPQQMQYISKALCY